MATTIINNGVVATTVFRGQQLSIVTDSLGKVLVERFQGDTPLDKVQVGVSTTRVFGEYLIDLTVRLSCIAGTATFDVTQDTAQVKTRATVSNDNAAAGAIGEILSTTVAAGASVAETTATPVDVCTLALTPGDWDVSAIVDRTLTGVTATVYAAGISLTLNTMPSQAGGSGLGTDPAMVQYAAFGATVTGNFTTPIPPVQVSIAANTTLHLVAADTFSAGTVGVFGTLRARRIR